MAKPIESESSGKMENVPLIYYILEDLQNENLKSKLSAGAIGIVKKLSLIPGLTRKELISQMKIRPGTVTKIVSQLINDGILYEIPPENTPDRGRPEVPLYINNNKWIAAAVSCDSKEITAMLINAADQILDSQSIEISPLLNNAELERRLFQIITDLLSSRNIPGSSNVISISLSMSGIVNSIDKVLSRSARWPNVKNFSLVNLAKKIKIPLSVHRQLDVQLHYEITVDPGLRTKNVLLFHWGYGIGGSFSVQGAMIAPQTTSFCQVGHIPINPDSTKRCICGKLGCLETEAAYWAVESEAVKLFGPIGDKNEIEAAAFFQLHPLTTEAFYEKAEDAIAHALSLLQSILVPDVILLYGIFFESPGAKESLIAKIKRKSSPFYMEKTEFRFITASHSWNARAVSYYDFITVLGRYFRDFFHSGKNEGGRS